jgi:DNA-binding NtrC family response regulator
MPERDVAEPPREGVPTQQLILASSVSGGGLLRVFGSRVFLAVALPLEGSWTVGRAPGCDVLIDDDSVSRVHAVLHFGAEVEIEDVGSSNGTRLSGVEVPRGDRVVLRPGQLAELGAVVISIEREASMGPRRVWDRETFGARLAQDCATRAGFAVARVRIHREIPPAMAEAALLQSIGAHDLVTSPAAEHYDVLLVDRDEEALQIWLRAVATLLHRIAGTPEVAIARFPEHGRSPATLLEYLGGVLDGRLASATARGPSAQVVIKDEAMLAIHRLIERVAASDITVLLTGETGVGKEVLAEQIHQASPRRAQPLVRLNCAALPEQLLESELFGHERGAFTGATHAKHGLFEAAAGGTVLLDEIGEMSLPIQAKLLRVLDERKVWPVGALRPRPIDVRFIAATNRNLEEEVAEGRFRQDLFFRLRGVQLAVPPLRERRGEILPLARLFVERAAGTLRISAPTLTGDAEKALERHPWPGNIRELRNVIDRAVLLAGDTIGPRELELDHVRALGSSIRLEAPGEDLDGEIAALERDRILEMLERCGGNQSEAARRLGMSRSKLIARLDRYGAPRPRKPG